MSSKHSIEVDCTRRCRSRRHGQVLTGAITKRSVTNESLASFIKGTCANFSKAFDTEGRTALHMASSRGRVALMGWLARHSSEAFANARDRESGYTPLHRAVFYGQINCAVALMKMGVNTDIVDKDDYKALEHATLDRHYMRSSVKPDEEPTDAYVWGSNTNYTLGTGTQQQRNTPEMTSFSRANASVSQVCLGKFHSVWVCGGVAWAAGQAGRAGGAGGHTALKPTALALQEPVAAAAVTLDSTVLLMQSGVVLQYSITSADAAPQPSKTSHTIKPPHSKPVLKLSKPLGLCSGRHHAMVWNTRAVYTWGTNLGQLGHPAEEAVVPAPKRVSISMNTTEEAGFTAAAAADAASVLATARGDVYLLHGHMCRKIAIKQINLTQLCVEARAGSGEAARVTVLMLTSVGQLLIWQDSTNRVTRCVFGLAHQISITHVALTHDAVYFTTKLGEAFIGHISRKAPPPTQAQPIRREREKDNNKSALVKFLEKDDCTSVRIYRIPNVHRATQIFTDAEGLNFAVLQAKPTCGLTALPQLSPSSMAKHMESLLETASEDDMLHDVVFQVGSKLYPAHTYVVASSSEYLFKLYQEHLTDNAEKPVVPLPNIRPEVFDRILRYMYTGTCDVTETGHCNLKIRREDLINEKKEKDSNGNDDDVDVELIENPTEVSAFEVYKNEKKPRGRGRRGGGGTGTGAGGGGDAVCDPVRLVQAAARRLHLTALVKLLDNFYCRDGKVCVRESATLSKGAAPWWERDSLPALCDTAVSSKDGIAVPAHRCILAARLEYFQGMFMHSWTESKSLSKVTLPINHGILLPIINFLYTDTCPEVQNSESIDYICSMLIVSDQLFITRLKEMCEVALANLISLKNCAELCQFAHTYNALQLKQCCMQFISLNLCNILENKLLDVLEENLLEDISQYYCKFNPIMSSRVITPFFNAPADEVVDEFAKSNPVDLERTDEEYRKDDSVIEVKKKKSSKKIEYTDREKARMRYESVSSANGLDFSNDNGDITLSLSKIPKENEKEPKKQDKWIEVPTAQLKQQKVVQARLKAINSAKEILNEPPVESFTKLIKNNSSSAISSVENTPSTSGMSVSPKDSPIAEMARSPPGYNVVISHVGPKLSQKQRKKLAMQGEGSSPQSLDNYLANKLSLSTSQEKPKNPWKICEAPVASSSPKVGKASSSMEFNQILADQKKQKDDSSRIMTKPLLWTQLEDKAIEELERFYNIHGIDDELITVRRIELQVSSPQWIHSGSK